MHGHGGRSVIATGIMGSPLRGASVSRSRRMNAPARRPSCGSPRGRSREAEAPVTASRVGSRGRCASCCVLSWPAGPSLFSAAISGACSWYSLSLGALSVVVIRTTRTTHSTFRLQGTCQTRDRLVVGRANATKTAAACPCSCGLPFERSLLPRGPDAHADGGLKRRAEEAFFGAEGTPESESILRNSGSRARGCHSRPSG